MSKRKYEIEKVRADEESITDWGNLLSTNHFISIVAGPGSGKTSYIVNHILNPNFYGDKSNKKCPVRWRNIIYISPSYKTDKTLAPLRKLQEDETNDLITITPIYEDLENMDTILRAICDDLNSEEVKAEHKEENIKTVIVIDDSSTLMKKTSSSYIARLVSTYRHIGAFGIDVLVVAQRFKTLPPQIRTCASGFLIYKINNKTDLKAITEELGSTFGEDEFLQCYEEATKEKYSFLTVDMRKLLLRNKYDDPPLFIK